MGTPLAHRAPARRMLSGALVLLLAATLSGCVYRMNIQQGNYLEERAVEQLKEGMTRSQVRYLLGTPMVPDAFDKNRWDYLYYFKRGRLHAPQQRHLTVYFEDDKVARIERGDEPPGQVAREAPIPAEPQEPIETPPPVEQQAKAGPAGESAS